MLLVVATPDRLTIFCRLEFRAFGLDEAVAVSGFMGNDIKRHDFLASSKVVI